MAITVKQAGTPFVAGTALVMSVVVLILLLVHFFMNRQGGQESVRGCVQKTETRIRRCEW